MAPRHARAGGSGGRIAWRGPLCHRRVDQCCGTMVGASGRRVAAAGGACRAVVDELDREWRPGEQIIVEMPDGQVLRC